MDAFLLVNIIKMPQNMQVVALFVSVMSAVITMISVIVAVMNVGVGGANNGNNVGNANNVRERFINMKTNK